MITLWENLGRKTTDAPLNSLSDTDKTKNDLKRILKTLKNSPPEKIDSNEIEYVAKLLRQKIKDSAEKSSSFLDNGRSQYPCAEKCLEPCEEIYQKTIRDFISFHFIYLRRVALRQKPFFKGPSSRFSRDLTYISKN